MSILFFLFVGVALVIFLAAKYSQPENLVEFDLDAGELFPCSEQSRRRELQFFRQLQFAGIEYLRTPAHKRLRKMREDFDKGGLAFSVDQVSYQNGQIAGIACEFVETPDSDPDRIVLYLHGGGFSAGSAVSHRPITSEFARVARARVIAVNYRLMPEHKRRDCLADCQRVYRALAGSSDRVGNLGTLIVAGDSAGGNLSLVLAAWARDLDLRQADAVIALCPVTDSCVTSSDLARQVSVDPMLGPVFAPLLKMPPWLRRLLVWGQNRIPPNHPMVSPVYGDLSRLPPTLVQVAERDVLRSEGVRYVNKAKAQGSPAKLQQFMGMYHVWHPRHQESESAAQAFKEIEKFLAEHT